MSEHASPQIKVDNIPQPDRKDGEAPRSDKESGTSPLNTTSSFQDSRENDLSLTTKMTSSSPTQLYGNTTSCKKRRKTQEHRQSISNIDYQQISALHKAFLDRWDGKDLGLTPEEFQRVARQTINLELSVEESKRIFKQMDLKETGRMRWCDYITNVSQTAQLRSYMAAQEIKPLLQDKMQFIKTKHRDEIISIRFIPRLSMQSTKVNYNRGRYLMLGRHGFMTLWSLDLSLISTHYIGANEGLSPLFFIDMVVLYPSTLIAVTSTDRKISMYELGSRGIQEKYSIVALGNSVTCLDFWSDLHNRTSSLLVWGDTAGDIHSLELNVNRLGGVFDKDKNQEIINRVAYADLVKNKVPTARLYRAAGLHDDWVTSVKYIPENKAFLSSSRSNTRQSMVYSDWNGKVDSRYFQSDKAVLCFDYNHVLNILVTGSLDCRVRVWNFFMAQRPVSALLGHTSPITHLCLNAATQHVISADKSRAIKIFNYMEGTIIQSFSGPSLQGMGGRAELTGFFFNDVRCQLIVATTMLAEATKRTNPPCMAEISAHDFPITAICYSHTFAEIITACADAVISVWEVHTGRHLLQFKHHSPRSRFQDLPWARDSMRLEVSAMTLDDTQKCALTGANDGTVNLWNFSTGVLLSYYTLPENGVVTGLAFDRLSIYATGTFKQIYQLQKDQISSKEPPKNFNRYHDEEINCLALVKGGLLATGSYDGDIIIVSRDTGHPLCLLNAGESQMPQPMRGAKEERREAAGVSETEEDNGSCFSSEDELISTEDQGILKCIRINDDLVMVSNPVTGHAHIIKKPRQEKESPTAGMIFDVLKGKHVSQEESASAFRAYESSVEALLCLHTRKNLDAYTATVISAGSEGWIRAWSLNPKGGLKGQFLATEFLGEEVKAMATDKENEFLITGDTRGYIKVWDLFAYCNAAIKQMTLQERQERRDKFIDMFIFLRSPFLRDKASEGFKQCKEFHKRPPPEESNPDSTLRTPSLLNVFRAHMQDITSIEYVNEHKLILSGGKDCSVRVWSIRGSFVGQCGAPWNQLPEIGTAKQPPRVLPRDLRRNASARSFRVVKAGCTPLWEHAVRCVKNYLEEQRKEANKKAMQLEAQKMEALERGEDLEQEIVGVEAESPLTQPVAISGDELELPENLRLVNVVTFDWQDPKKSRLLGKSFRPNLHHRHSPVPRVTIDDDFGMYPAYRKIKVADITHMTRIPTPQLVKDMETRRREEEEDAQRWRGGPKKKTKGAAKPLVRASLSTTTTPRRTRNSQSTPLEVSPDHSESDLSSSFPTHATSIVMPPDRAALNISSNRCEQYPQDNVADFNENRLDRFALDANSNREEGQQSEGLSDAVGDEAVLHVGDEAVLHVGDEAVLHVGDEAALHVDSEHREDKCSQGRLLDSVEYHPDSSPHEATHLSGNAEVRPSYDVTPSPPLTLVLATGETVSFDDPLMSENSPRDHATFSSATSSIEDSNCSDSDFVEELKQNKIKGPLSRDKDSPSHSKRRSRQTCIFPPLSKSWQFDVARKPDSSRPFRHSTTGNVGSKTPQLPAMWIKQSTDGSFKGTGLFFGR